ncbi:MAG TPA: helix-turn-helix transcriptional regulator [Streptosporangiaceae bacterium]
MTEAITVTRHASGLGRWEMAGRAPHPALRGHLSRYAGYWEDTVPLRRREVPSGVVPLIISFGDPIDVSGLGEPRHLVTSFAGGLTDAPAITEHGGRQHGVQVDLTPLGAYRLFGVPMRELANRVVALDDLFGPAARVLAERLAGAPGWAARFALLDDELARRLVAGPEPSAEVAWAWRRLVRTGGTLRVGELAREVEWSPRHLVTRFGDQVGMSPKPVARMLRFQRAARLALRGAPLAAIAVRCGYYDQAHLNREFRALAGCTPSGYRAAVLPDNGGVAG